MKTIRVYLLYLTVGLVSLCNLSYAAQPVWTFTPLTATTVSVADGQTETIRYTVTNQSSKTHTLAMTPITGITQITSGAGICANPFTLTPGDPSCTLSLSVNGSTLPGNVVGGPVVCQQGSTLQCYQPSTANQLNITKADGATISLAGSPLNLLTSGSAGTMEITNTSASETALNIEANFSGTALDGNVDQDASNCSTLPPQASCTLTFTSTSGSTPVTATSFPIAGSNTNTVMGAITITPPPHIIFVTNSIYTGNLGGLNGANAKCNADSAKPSTGFAAGYTYKALLNGNNATVDDASYYRPDGTTLIAIATGGNLVGAASLTNSISTSGGLAWTGGSLNCVSWMVNLSIGTVGSIDSSTFSYWTHDNYPCDSSYHLYCVSQ